MPGELAVAGQQPHALLLRLYQQQLVKWIPVVERRSEFGCGMIGGEEKLLVPGTLQYGQNDLGAGRAFAFARSTIAVPFETQLPDRHCGKGNVHLRVAKQRSFASA